MSEGHLPQHPSNEKYTESMMNMALLDPPKWGWPAVGGVTDLLTPHERARRKESKKAFLKAKKLKRARPLPHSNNKNGNSFLKPPPPTENSQLEKKPPPDQQQPAAESKPNSEAAPGSQAVPATGSQDKAKDPSTTNGSRTENKDNQQNKEDFKPAAKPSEPLTTTQTTTPVEDGKALAQSEPPEATPKPTNDVTMTEAQAPPPPTDAQEMPPPEDTTTKEITVDDNVLKIEALRGDGNLDIYAYHRGREGLEPRDAATGELLADVEQTDTNHKFDEPKLSLQVTVSFPLDDPSGGKSDPPTFEDTIHWNLGDPETPTPEAFAIATAEEFGLTFGQAMDLAGSIQQQIYRHNQDHCGYSEPVAMDDGAGMERTHIPPPTICHMYGRVMGTAEPGTYCAKAAPSSKKSKNRGQVYGMQGSSSRRGAAGRDDRASRPPPMEYFDEEPVEDIYVEEVKKRMIEYSREHVARTCEENGDPLGRLELMQNHVCHICHKRHNLTGKFACGNQSHSYCATHLRNRLKLHVQGLSEELYFDYCPVCAVTCLCSKCGRRREALGIQLKRKGQEQGVDPSSTVFEGMFTCFTKPAAAMRIAKQAAAASRKKDTSETLSVGTSIDETSSQDVTISKPTPKPKASRKPSIREPDQLAAPVIVGRRPPPTEFPREIRGGVDADPGSSIDYRTVYTSEGHVVKCLESLPKQSKPKAADGPPAVAEDGNVEYCHKCRQGGALLCCDYCPRSFHAACLEEGNGQSGGTWECPVCKRAKQDLPEYTLSGSESQAKICAAFSDLNPTCDDDLTQLTLLSKIHEMLEKLMKTDMIGPVFAVPVDPRVAPDYPKIIKKPMDLGTISSKLLNGGYKQCFEAHKSWADVHLAILKDIELVWNNCFTFNYEGSAYYKMAEDLRRRMVQMRARSLDKDLPDSVVRAVDEYVKTCRKERGKIPVPAILDGRPKSRWKITIRSTKIGRSTKVAILDPETGMVVKIYSTIKAAFMAAEDVLRRGYQGEITLTDFAMKSLIKKSTDDPSATLFGYRWLELDKLHAGLVRFSAAKPSTAMFELNDGKSAHTFLSLDEALTHRLSRDKPAEEMRKALLQLTEGGEGVKMHGLHWRRRKFVADGKALHKDIVLAPFWQNNGKEQGKEAEEPPPSGTSVLKEDLILGRTTGRFATVEAAFEDWEFACKSSPSVPPDEITESSFYTYYLDGDRNVDGLIWKTVDPADDEGSQATKTLGPDDGQASAVTESVAEMSNSLTLVSREEEEAVVVEKGNVGAMQVDETTELEHRDGQAESSAENLPAESTPSSDNHCINGSEKAPLVDAPVNGVKKRERSHEEDLMPRKK